MYTEYVNQLVTTYFNDAYLFPKIDSLKTLIRPYVVSDTYYSLDYGFSMSDFDNSFTQALGGHVDYGLKPYISTRNSSATNQIDQVALFNEVYAKPDYLKIINDGNEVFVFGNQKIANKEFNVFNMAGQMVFNGQLKTVPQRINLKSGIYLISIPEIQVSNKLIMP